MCKVKQLVVAFSLHPPKHLLLPLLSHSLSLSPAGQHLMTVNSWSEGSHRGATEGRKTTTVLYQIQTHIFSKYQLVLLLRTIDIVTDKKLTACQYKNNTPLCPTCKKRNLICMLSVVKTPVWELPLNRTWQIKKKRERGCNLNLMIKTAEGLVMGL